MQCEAVISPSFAVKIYYNGDAWWAFIFVQNMVRCRVGPVLTGGTFVLLCACFRSRYSCPMQYEVGISPSFLVTTYYNGDARCALIFVQWMETCRVWPARIAGTFIWLLCARCQSCCSFSRHYEVASSSPFPVKIYLHMMLGARSSFNVCNVLDEQIVRLCCCVLAFKAFIYVPCSMRL